MRGSTICIYCFCRRFVKLMEDSDSDSDDEDDQVLLEDDYGKRTPQPLLSLSLSLPSHSLYLLPSFSFSEYRNASKSSKKVEV